MSLRFHRPERLGAVLVSLALLTAPVVAAESGWCTQPALHGDRLVFVSEGDLWTATLGEEDGAAIVAHRLTTMPGNEGWPCLSTDGQWLAFSGEIDGNRDVFIMPASGGRPRRLTFHPGRDTPLGFTPKGNAVLFRSARHQPLGRPELWRIGVGGGMPLPYGFGECTLASVSATGNKIAFNRWSNENWNWRGYRGGTAPEIWLGDLDTDEFRVLAPDAANDLFPMWFLGRVYFLSDRDDHENIWSVRPDSEDLRQHTRFAQAPSDPTAIQNYAIRFPRADARRGGTRIVFSQGAQLALLDVRDDSVTRLDVRLASDRRLTGETWVDPIPMLTEFDVAPEGDRMVIGARGEVAVIPLGDSKPVGLSGPLQLTRSSGAREWGATFMRSPAGDLRLALITDASGEQQIATVAADGSDQVGLLTDDRTEWLFPPRVSPSGEWLAYGDKSQRLSLVNTTTLEKRLVDTSEAWEITDYRFSPDGRWLAYAKPMPNGYSSVHLYSIRTERSFPVSNGLFDDQLPRWDPAGKYLYFVSRRHFDPTLGTVDFEHVFLRMSEVYVVPLAADTPPPFPAVAHAAGYDLKAWATDEGDEESTESESANAAPDGAEDPADQSAGPRVEIDTDGLTDRAFRLPIEHGRITDLEAIQGGVLLLRRPVVGLNEEVWPGPAIGVPDGHLQRFDALKQKSVDLADDVATFSSSTDGSRVVAYRGTGLVEITSPEKRTPIDLHGFRLRADRTAEWSQMLTEAWRLQRDFFWDPDMRGVDWPAIRTRYAALLPLVSTRQELDTLIGEMIGELGTSHTYVFSRPTRATRRPVRTGLLGVDVVSDGAGVRIERVLPSRGFAAAGASEQLLSPLAAPWLAIEPGMYIKGVDGVAVTPTTNLFDLLQDRAERAVRVTVANDAQGRGSRTVEVTALGSERPLRYADWVESNRRHVAEASEGRLGYLHIPDMGGEGLTAFSRLFFPQVDLSGMVVDVRSNGGGFVSQMIIQRLARRVWAYQVPRHGRAERYPQRTLDGHLAVLIDQHAGSDGDIFPESFRILDLGPLIGTRTWGGVVGIRGDKPFMDLGVSTQPEFAWWEPKRGWSLENSGVAPDIEVRITPGDRMGDRDPQLDRAIDVLLKALEDSPVATPTPPSR